MNAPSPTIPSVWADYQKRVVSEWAEMGARASKALALYANPPEVSVGDTPSEVVWEENKLRVLRYKPTTGRKYKTPVLIVYALVNRPSILDLQPDRSVVRRLLEAGHDVYLIDWGTPSTLDRHLTLDDYVNRYIHNAVRAAKRASGADQVSILGYCMGGAMSAMYTSLHPKQVKTLCLMAAPLDFQRDTGLLTEWARPEHFNVDAVVDAYGNIPPDFLAGGFAYLKPFDNTFGKLVNFYRIADDQTAVENFLRMEQWNNDGISLPGETYRQYIKDLYQHNRLASGEMQVGGKPIHLKPFTMPILCLTASADHLVPPETTRDFVERLPSKDKSFIEARAGHIGLAVSSRSHKDIWPKVAQWFAERAEPV